MLFRTMALEDPEIRILNYAPGPLDTDMQHEARTHTGDTEIKKMFIGKHTIFIINYQNQSSVFITTLFIKETFLTSMITNPD